MATVERAGFAGKGSPGMPGRGRIMRASRVLLTMATILTVVVSLFGAPSPGGSVPTAAAADSFVGWEGTITTSQAFSAETSSLRHNTCSPNCDVVLKGNHRQVYRGNATFTFHAGGTGSINASFRETDHDDQTGYFYDNCTPDCTVIETPPGKNCGSLIDVTKSGTTSAALGAALVNFDDNAGTYTVGGWG